MAKLSSSAIGFFNIDKPAGCTSRDVVNRIQRELRVKAGHAGTLDPLATGVLVVAIGKATRLIPYVQAMRKSYRGEFLLGRSSDTEDVAGNVVREDAPVQPTRSELESALTQFRGEIDQRPPRYSAIKLQGKRAYDLARAGQDFELETRRITIHDLQLLRYDYPRFEIDVCCSSGTYVRALGRDIAVACQTQAVMAKLSRTAIGVFTIANAIAPDKIKKENAEDYLQPALSALSDLPRIELDESNLQRITNGQRIRAHATSAAEIVAVDQYGQLASILRPRDGELQPVRNFL